MQQISLKCLIFLGCLLVNPVFSFSQQNAGTTISIIPEPVSLRQGTGAFTISPETVIVLQGNGMENSAHFLNLYLKKYYGFQLPVKNHAGARAGASNAIVLRVRHMDHDVKGAYTLDVTGKQVLVSGDNAP